MKGRELNSICHASIVTNTDGQAQEPKLYIVELVKSLVYRLERLFPGTDFIARDAEGCIIVVPDQNSPEPVDGEAIRKSAHEFLQASNRIFERTSPVLIDSHRSSRKHQGPAVRSDVRQTPVPGACWLGPDAQEALELFDKLFAAFAVRLGAATVYGPSLIAQEDLERCGYLPKDVHQVSFLHKKSGMPGVTQEERVCLSPAACLSTYPVLRASSMRDNTALTLRGKVFRREGGRLSPLTRPLERMREYDVRELIFFGGLEFKDHIQSEYFKFLGQVGRSLDISFDVSSATDLFFHAEYSSLASYQLMTRSKFEFNFHGEDSTVALASFNSHGDQFTKAFDIRGSSGEFQSFCIGFGLQKWVQAELIAFDDFKEAKNIIRELIAGTE